jgi:hypothetical protein
LFPNFLPYFFSTFSFTKSITTFCWIFLIVRPPLAKSLYPFFPASSPNGYFLISLANQPLTPCWPENSGSIFWEVQSPPSPPSNIHCVRLPLHLPFVSRRRPKIHWQLNPQSPEIPAKFSRNPNQQNGVSTKLPSHFIKRVCCRPSKSHLAD